MDHLRMDVVEEEEDVDVMFVAEVPGTSATTETIQAEEHVIAAVQVKEDPKLTQELLLSVFSNGLVSFPFIN